MKENEKTFCHKEIEMFLKTYSRLFEKEINVAGCTVQVNGSWFDFRDSEQREIFRDCYMDGTPKRDISINRWYFYVWILFAFSFLVPAWLSYWDREFLQTVLCSVGTLISLLGAAVFYSRYQRMKNTVEVVERVLQMGESWADSEGRIGNAMVAILTAELSMQTREKR